MRCWIGRGNSWATGMWRDSRLKLRSTNAIRIRWWRRLQAGRNSGTLGRATFEVDLYGALPSLQHSVPFFFTDPVLTVWANVRGSERLGMTRLAEWTSLSIILVSR